MRPASDRGFFFKDFEPKSVSPFDKLFDIFKELIVYVSGDFDEAITWLRELDKEYELTDENYTIDDFINDLRERGYIRPEVDGDGVPGMGITAKTERLIRQTALDQIFGNLNKSGSGTTKPKVRARATSLRAKPGPTALATASKRFRSPRASKMRRSTTESVILNSPKRTLWSRTANSIHR